MEQVVTYFSNAGVPASGLSPTVNIAERNGTMRVTGGLCKEIPNMPGFYAYDFNEYNSEKQYIYLFDGGNTLNDSDRYIAGNNELDSYSFKQSWGRTVAATTPYDDTKINKRLDNIEKLSSREFPKQEKVDLSGIEKRLKALEEKKIDFPKVEFPKIDIPKVDIEGLRKEFNLKIDELKSNIKPGISKEEVRKEMENVFESVVNEDRFFNQLIEEDKKSKQNEATLRKFIKSLSVKK